MATIDVQQLQTVGECARRWGLCEATVRNAVRRIFGDKLPRIGRARVLTSAQAETVKSDLISRGMTPVR